MKAFILMLLLPLASYGEDKVKYRFVYFGATWCGPCRQMKANTFTNANVKKTLEDFDVSIYDYDTDIKLAKQYKVHSVPTYFIVSKDGKILKQQSGSMGPDAFIQWLK